MSKSRTPITAESLVQVIKEIRDMDAHADDLIVLRNVKKMIKEHPHIVIATNYKHNSPLVIAILYNRVLTAEYLLKMGAYDRAAIHFTLLTANDGNISKENRNNLVKKIISYAKKMDKREGTNKTDRVILGGLSVAIDFLDRYDTEDIALFGMLYENISEEARNNFYANPYPYMLPDPSKTEKYNALISAWMPERNYGPRRSALQLYEHVQSIVPNNTALEDMPGYIIPAYSTHRPEDAMAINKPLNDLHHMKEILTYTAPHSISPASSASASVSSNKSSSPSAARSKSTKKKSTNKKRGGNKKTRTSHKHTRKA
jgi:hypothetical protein